MKKWQTSKKVWLLALPLILSNLSAPLLGLVDTAIIGHLDSPVFLASVALGSNYFMLLYFSLNFLRMSTTGYSAQAKGGNHSQLEVLLRALFLAFVLALLLIAINPWISKVALLAFGASSEATVLASSYINTRILGALATLANFVIIGFAIGLQKPKVALLMTLFMHTTNAILSYIFVYIYSLDVVGVAFASVIAEYLGMAVGLYLLRSEFVTIRTLKKATILKLDAILKLVRVNSDLFIRSITLLGVFFFFTATGAKMGDTTLAANAVLISFLLIVSNFLDAFANAAEALVGESIGKRDLRSLKNSLIASFFSSLLVAILLFVAFFAFGKSLISLLTDIEEVRVVASDHLFWIVILPLASVGGFFLDGVFVGALLAHKMRNSMLLSVVLFFLVFYAFEVFQNHALWLAMTLFMFSRGLIMLFMWINHYNNLKKGSKCHT